MVNIDDFSKLDIRIGEILKAEKIPEGDKLLKLEIDLGEENQRTILAGIAEYVPEPETLIGRQIPVLSNIEPRKLKGHESNGMILAVGGEKGFVLLHPEEKVPNGSKIK